MTLLHSPPQLDTPWRDLITAAVAAVILPSGLGMALLAVFSLFGGVFATEWNIGLWAAGMALMLSPFLSAPGMMLALPVTSLLIKMGWFGWVPAALTGLVIGAVIGALTDFPPGAVSGMSILLIMRAVLGVMRPMRR